MKVKKIRQINDRGDGRITIIHSDGSFYYEEQDVTLKEWTNNFFCRFNIDCQSKWQRFIFWNWVLSFSFGFILILNGLKFNQIPLEKRRGLTDFVGASNLFYVFVIITLCYFLVRLMYFFFYRDFFSKDLIHISLKSNQNILLIGKENVTKEIGTVADEIRIKIKNIISNNRYFNAKKKIYENASDRIFDTNGKNGKSLINEYSLAVSFFIICFYSVYSTWGENSITDSDPYSQYIAQLALLKEKHEFLEAAIEFNEANQLWEQKYKNEKISSFYFFSLGYVLPLLIVSIVYGGIALFGFLVAFLVYLVFWPVVNVENRLSNQRELNKVLKKKLIYPLVIILFLIGVIANYILTGHLIVTIVFILTPIFPTLALLILLILITLFGDGGPLTVRDVRETILTIFSRNYWRFLISGKPDYSSAESFLHIIVMIAVPWSVLLYHVLYKGYINLMYKAGTTSFTIQEIIFAAIIFVVIMKFIRRAISPWGREHFGVNLTTIKNGIYLRYFKNDYLSFYSMVNENGLMLEFASDRLKDHYKIIERAVQNNGLSLQFASVELRNDKKIVLKAIKQNPKAIEYTSIELQSDPDIIEQIKNLE